MECNEGHPAIEVTILPDVHDPGRLYPTFHKIPDPTFEKKMDPDPTQF